MLHHLHVNYRCFSLISDLDFDLIHGACDYLLGVPQDHELRELSAAQSLQLLHALKEQKLFL